MWNFLSFSAALAVLCCYLAGSLSFAVLVSRYYGMADPRSYGSGNPGATNVLRSGHKKAAALTLLGDALKGLAAVAAVRLLQNHFGWVDEVPALCAVAALAGHMWPVFFGFKGGKGVATALGVLTALCWPVAAVCAAIWLLLALGLRISSLAALTAAASAPVSAYLFTDKIPWLAAIVVITLLVLARHHSNIRKLLNGTENKIGS